MDSLYDLACWYCSLGYGFWFVDLQGEIKNLHIFVKKRMGIVDCNNAETKKNIVTFCYHSCTHWKEQITDNSQKSSLPSWRFESVIGALEPHLAILALLMCWSNHYQCLESGLWSDNQVVTLLLSLEVLLIELAAVVEMQLLVFFFLQIHLFVIIIMFVWL